MGTFSQDFNMNKLILFALFALVAVTLAYPEYDRPAASGEMDSVEGESMESGPWNLQNQQKPEEAKVRVRAKRAPRNPKVLNLKNLDQWNAAQARRKRNPALRKEPP